MVLFMKDNSIMEFDLGKVNGNQIKQQLTLTHTKDNMKVIRKMDMENTNGQMDHNMRDFSKMI